MKLEYKTKSIDIKKEDIDAINKYSIRNMNEDEIYTFSVILCDNEIDRDYERFSVDSIYELSKLYLGTTGIFDHDTKGENQTARIYNTEVIVDLEKKTSLNENYTYLKAKAYMVKNRKNESLILEIDGGIKKEVSVGCRCLEQICSICGKKIEKCSHKKGSVYGEKQCYYILNKPVDAYEWSFVAVPAQRNAGVTKKFNQSAISIEYINKDDIINIFKNVRTDITISAKEANNIYNIIEKQKQLALFGSEYRQELIIEVVKLSFLLGEEIKTGTLKSMLNKLDIKDIKELRESYRERLSKNYSKPQLMPIYQENPLIGINEFKI